jgi:tRNA nucleotidyltransferase (CCA-adding enzyme)
MKLPKEVEIALKLLEKSGFEAYLVGGCVRDSILDIKQKDFDITTDAEPNEILDTFQAYKVIETGLKHGTVTVLIHSVPLEITTYREDGNYSDNRRPDNVKFIKSLKEDLARRDFTMNAIAYNPKTGFVDYFGGVEDIQGRVIRAVGDPGKRFREDSLRILRGLRFASVYGFKIEEVTARAMLDLKELLRNISAERIAVELIKTLSGINMKQVMTEFYEVYGAVIPELLPMVGFEQQSKYHIYDVYLHSIMVAQSIENKPYFKLAALLHDIGKPITFTIDEEGTGHFYGHAEESVRIADDILSRLKLDNYTKERVLELIKYHDTLIQESDKGVKRWLNRLTPDLFFDLPELKRADKMAQNPDLVDASEDVDLIRAIAERILFEKQCFSLKDLSVDGKDLIELGYVEGKEIGEMLNLILEMVIENRLKNSKNEIKDFIDSNLSASDEFK